MFNVAYNVAKFVAVFLAVSVAIAFAALVLPQYKAQLEYVGWALLVVAEIVAFTYGREWQFSLRSLLIAITALSAALGVWVAMKA